MRRQPAVLIWRKAHREADVLLRRMREIKTYHTILESHGLGTAACYWAIVEHRAVRVVAEEGAGRGAAPGR